DALLAKGMRVVCVDNLDTGNLANIEHIRTDAFEFVNHDLIDHLEVAGPVDFVYHLASPASPIDYLRLPLHTLKVGSYGTHNALGLAKFKRARFLIASTSEVYGDPKVHPQPGSFCYVADLIRGLYLLAGSDEHMPVNIGNPREFTLLELAETVVRLTGSESEIVFEALPEDDPQVRQPDITRAREILDWEPQI